MTTIQSIKNDAMTVGTAAVSAGATSVILNNQQGIKSAAAKAAENIGKTAAKTIKKDTYSKMSNTIKKENFGKIADTILKNAKKPFNKKVYKDMADKFKNMKFDKNTVSNCGKNIKDAIADWGLKTKTFMTTSWKFKGAVKTAGVAAAVALGIVVLKNIFSKNDAE